MGTNDTAIYRFSDVDTYGTVTIWIYDKGTTSGPERKHGPRWGLLNSFDDKFVVTMTWAPFLDGNRFYGHIATSENAWFNRWGTGLNRSQGWHKFTFIHSDERTLRVVMDDQFEASLTPIDKLRFEWGFNGVYLYGGDPTVEGVYVGRIQIEAQ